MWVEYLRKNRNKIKINAHISGDMGDILGNTHKNIETLKEL